MPNLTIPLTKTSTEYITLLPDGTEYSNKLTFPGVNTIGEKKRVRLNYTASYPSGMGGVNLWMKVGIFNQGVIGMGGTNIPINQSITFPAGLTPGTYPMAMSLPVGAPYNVNNNVQSRLIIVDDDHFKIEIDFYQMYDELSYQQTVNQDNHNKLFRDSKFALTDLTIGPGNTCYNSAASSFCVDLLFQKPGQVHPEVYPDVYPYTDNVGPIFGVTWMAGFYNRDPNNSDPYFSNPQFLLTRSALSVSNLSVSQNTDVKFTIETPTTVEKILVWCVRSDKFDNVTDMYGNYEADFKDIITSGTFTDKIVGPIENVTSLGAGVYEIGFSLDKMKLVNGGKYRLIAIVYKKDGALIVQGNSFMSDEYSVSGVPCYDGNGFDVKASLDDYNTQFEGNSLDCVIEERLRSKLKLSFAFDKWKNDMFNRLGIVVGNDIRRYLVSVGIEIFEEYPHPTFGMIKNILDTKQSNKVGASSYTAQTGLTLAFSNTWAEFMYEWRNRFEDDLPAIQTLVNGYNTIPVMSTQYWGDRAFTFRWTLKFTYDNFSTPFTDTVIVDQYLRIKNYGELNVFPVNSDTIIEQEAFCQDPNICFIGKRIADIEGISKLIVNIRPLEGSITSIEEAESWEGNQLSQMTTPKINYEEENYTAQYGGKAAKFCVNGNELLVNSQYIISAMAKKYVDTGFRVTETLEQRVTEENDRRTIDNL